MEENAHGPGLHILGNFYDCKGKLLASDFDADLTVASEPPGYRRYIIQDILREMVKAASLTPLDVYAHVFPNGGFTAMAVLEESHMSIHTWPEKQYVTVDVFVCNYEHNNRGKAEELFSSLKRLLKPGRSSERWIDRE